ncbi:MAG: sigma-70 family RNA polymerase sigma factor [Clostridia bacterium]|nr:sigma-70 family RNA polymerase sigma factor [Clostridia bacterium]
MSKQLLPTDAQIVALFWQRDEDALRLTEQKYRSYLLAVANNILHDRADAEECLNDTYLDAWNTIPPARPAVLVAYLVTIIRRRALDTYRRLHRQKRGGHLEVLPVDELTNDLPAAPCDADEAYHRAMGEAISDYLRSLPERQRAIFISRYYLCRPVAEIARTLGISRSTVQKQLVIIKDGLRKKLESEDISI